MVNTSAQSAPMMSKGTPRPGPAEHAGRSFTSDASRNGLQTKARRWLNVKLQMARCLLLGNGDVRAAISPKMFCRRLSLAGAKKNSIPNRSQACLLFHVGRHALGLTKYLGNVPILALYYATPVLARLVLRWGPLKVAIVVETPQLAVALTRIMNMVGAVDKPVAN